MSTSNAGPEELEPFQLVFLDAFAKVGSVLNAARVLLQGKPAPSDARPWTPSTETPTGIALLHYGWLASSQAYTEAFTLAKAMFGERLREIAIERAVVGEEEQVVSRGKLLTDEQGKPVTRRRYDKSLLKMLLQWSTKPWNDLLETLNPGATLRDTPCPVKNGSMAAPKAPTANGGPGQKVVLKGRVGYAID
jgi:hypothetical protein